MDSDRPKIVVTGANGLVGRATCLALAKREASVIAVVRRGGTAPTLAGVEEVVGEFHDREFAARVCLGAEAAVNTVHPMHDDHLQQASADWAHAFALAARDAGVQRLIQVSTTSVYQRDEHTGDVDEDSQLVDDSAPIYSVTKRLTDEKVAAVEGITTVLVRPTAVLGAGETSVWNTLRPMQIRDQVQARTDDPDRTFGWVHLNDLAGFIADLAVGVIAPSDDIAIGPLKGRVTAVNAVSGNVLMRDYLEPVAEAVGVEPVWESRPTFAATLLADRARGWGWTPQVTFDQAMKELLDGLT